MFNIQNPFVMWKLTREISSLVRRIQLFFDMLTALGPITGHSCNKNNSARSVTLLKCVERMWKSVEDDLAVWRCGR